MSHLKLIMRFNNSITFVTLFLHLHLFIHLQAYIPEEVFTINCGATGKFFDGERTWMGDTDLRLLSYKDGAVSAKATTQSPSTNQIPYTTARLSRSQFSYFFPISTGGPKFVRLFFYPASYPSFPRTDASFTVQCNQFILLDSFNASLNVDADKRETIFREYIIHVDDGQRLKLSFTPSQPNSYAFINGIEVFSMPNNLYYTPENDTGFKFMGSNTLYSLGSSFALETEYRIKVGGQKISPLNDTGLFRKWSGDEEDYLIKQNSQNNDLLGDLHGKMNITVNPDYVAPEELYKTARDMGTNATLNKIFNLTWEFPIHPGFTYMVRLHFCELDPNINEIGDRVFIIYIANQLADDQADVMRWTDKHRGLTVFKDYAVLIPMNNTQTKVTLTIQMHPHIEDGTSYNNPFLNGLEIFKISDSMSNNLAGPNPYPFQTSHNNIQKENTSNRTRIIGAIAGVVSGVVLISLVVFLVPKWSPHLFSTIKSTTTQNSSLPSDFCRRFSLVEIEAATKNFDDAFIIGAGGFGNVYKGYINGGSTPMAIKRLKPGSQQGAREFTNEIEMLSQLRHRHLVSLLGYCNDNNEMILVYDFMAHGNLRDHLYYTDNPPLSWKQRLRICIGAARGLRYLHSDANHMIIHRDVKTTNILLDDKWVAKVSDFGLSKLGPKDTSKVHVSTVVKGSFGYLDPEYCIRHRLTEKSDVYSFGVVLFEILCARPPLIHTEETQQLSLANWARYCYQNGTIADIVDPILKGKIAPECFTKFCEIGVSCLLHDGMQRPSMNELVPMLESVLKLQESAEQCKHTDIVTHGVQEKIEEDSDNVFNRGEHEHDYKDNDILLV